MRKFFFIQRKYGGGYRGQLGLIGFAFHYGPGQYGHGPGTITGTGYGCWSAFHWTLYTRVDRFGIWFDYKGDDLCWLWPWRREASRGCRYLNICVGGYFWDLKEVDSFWNEYWGEQSTSVSFNEREERGDTD